jgi:ubiquinone biosynthesis protein UbiJ
MAKKKDGKKDKKSSRTDTVRAAVDQAFQATAQATADAGQLTRGRATEIADELVGNITRLRDVLEDVRPATAEDLKALRTDLDQLRDRVAKLENARAASAIAGDGPKPRAPPPPPPAAAPPSPPPPSRAPAPARPAPPLRSGRVPPPRPPSPPRPRPSPPPPGPPSPRRPRAYRSPPRPGSPPPSAPRRPRRAPRRRPTARRARPTRSRRRARPVAPAHPLMAFASPEEFCALMDRLFEMMSTDATIGPRLRVADVPQRFAFPDLGLVVNVRASTEGEEGNLHWEWTDDVPWEPRVQMTMSSETANRYFQGRENIAAAIARRSIRTDGDVRAALELLPITRPVFGRYSELVAREYPHLVR